MNQLEVICVCFRDFKLNEGRWDKKMRSNSLPTRHCLKPRKLTRVQYPGFGADLDVLLCASVGAEEDGAIHHKPTYRHINFLDPGQRTGNLLKQKDIITRIII